MIILALHPAAQTAALVLAFYAAFLGFKRTRSLHFGQETKFNRDRHIVAGGVALIGLLLGMAGGTVMVARYLEKPILQSMHGQGAIFLLPAILFGLFSGFYMYLNPEKRKILPALHAFNNLVVLVSGIVQLFTGVALYLKLVAAG